MSYVCIQSEPACWTVGFYDPDGEWQSESDHSTPDGALARVAYLNGGGDALELRETVKQLYGWIANLEQNVIELRLAVFAASPDLTVTALQSIAAELKRANDRNDCQQLVSFRDPTPTERDYANSLVPRAEEYLNRQDASADAEADDPFMPPDGFWQWLPDAKCVAVDKSGDAFWYGPDIRAGEVAWVTVGISLMDADFGDLGSRDLNGADWRTTKRTRPAHL